MTNLLNETKEQLSHYGKNLKDIVWVGSEENYFTVEEFINVANTDYDSGYGAQEVARNLIIVGKDFWLERQEYAGSEAWSYRTAPTKPENKMILQALTVGQAEKLDLDVSCGWENLETLNGIKEEDS